MQEYRLVMLKKWRESCTLTISLIDWASSCFNFMDNVTFPYPITSEGDLTVMNPGPLVS